jgi:2,3-bisphosphoglycerate-independent phosphoglycerate mutase
MSMAAPLISRLVQPGSTRLLLVILDGLGGLARAETMRSELEKADIPNLDRLAERSDTGFTLPIATGVTPGGLSGLHALLGRDVLRDDRTGDPPLAAALELRTVFFSSSEEARLAATGYGFTALELDGFDAAPAALRAAWDRYDLFIVHSDELEGPALARDFVGKCRVLDRFDRVVPELLALGPDVFCLAGSHSTPSLLGRRTWHPVPLLIHSPASREGNASRFNEQDNLKGTLGVIPASELLSLLLAHGGRLKEFSL